MIKFKYFFENILFEGKVKSYQNFIHLIDIPMFSIFFDKDIFKNENLTRFTLIRRLEQNYRKLNDWRSKDAVHDFLYYVGPKLKEICAEARNIIGKMGFSSMHSNLVFTDNSKMINHNTGIVGGVAGYARMDKHYMSMDIDYFLKYREDNPQYLVKAIVHEWAHLWMFQNSKAFKQTVKDLYNELVLNKENLKLDPEIEREYNNKKSLEVLKFWHSMFNGIKNDRGIYNFIFERIDINENTAHLIPHGLTVWGHLKKTLNDDLKKDQRVYCEKGNSMWMVGYSDNTGRRKEITIPVNDLKQLNSIIRFIQFKNVKDAIKDRVNYTKHDIKEEDLENIIKKHIIMFFNTLRTYEYIKVPDEAIQQILPDYIKYIKNEILRLCNSKDSVSLTKILNSDKDDYDLLWVHNKSKPKEVSIANYIKPYAIESMVNKPFHQGGSLRNLSGSKYNDLREFISNQIKWVNGYGMSDDHELWATAIDGFFKLNKEHKKIFIDLINNKASSIPKKQKEFKQKSNRVKPNERRKLFKQNIFDKLKSLIEPELDSLVGSDGGVHEMRILQLVDKTMRDLKIRTKSNILLNALYDSVIEILNTNLDEYVKKRLKHLIAKEVENLN
jgi:hypothetical protein